MGGAPHGAGLVGVVVRLFIDGVDKFEASKQDGYNGLVVALGV